MQSGTFALGGSRVRWVPTDESLPMRTIERRAPVFGVIWALIFGSISVFLIRRVLLEIVREGLSMELISVMGLMFIVLLSIVIGFCLLGLSCVMYKKEIEIGLEQVKCSQRGLFGRKEWEEPLSDYQGVLKDVNVHVSAGPRDVSAGSRDSVSVKLRHPSDFQKNIVLWEIYRLDEEAAEERVRHFMQLLNLPRLEETEEGIDVKSAEDLEKTLRERHAGEEKPVSAIVPDLGKKVSIERAGEEWCLIRPGYYDSWKFLIGMLISGGILLVMSTLLAGEEGIWIGIALGGVFLLLFTLIFLSSLVGVEELFVTPSEIRYAKRYPWGRLGRKVIATDSVTDIHVKKNPQEPGFSAAVTVKAGQGTIKFGQSLPKSDKVKIKDLIRTLVLHG